ncbi:DUF2550 family protein [Corynebacterium glucuronolyticum]|uniref:DUF2550 family protein n=1 Tax=Corynebacterium glucuronolyticum TaxID=39791 RepID=A0A7T4EEL2_9CORY|nr:DUF2550 family protein [Corynebacterium glucuronolyticum]QQB45952.1 DUF2550 family protein [Corynebacterium glucuronolyticum]WKD63325.1 hypothetical protein CGLUCO_05300 [Corynebacterium glucuronolyticum DSM 44120]SMB77358.1 Protein of unknown function [Corynebacterium glucuronolyticum]
MMAIMCVFVIVILFLLWLRHNRIGQQVGFRRVGTDTNFRSGRIRYVDDTAGIFVFPSFTSEPYISLNRVTIDILDKKNDIYVIQSERMKLEMRLDRSEEMAFTSWLESAPSRRQQSVDKAGFRRFISRRAQ